MHCAETKRAGGRGPTNAKIAAAEEEAGEEAGAGEERERKRERGRGKPGRGKRERGVKSETCKDMGIATSEDCDKSCTGSSRSFSKNGKGEVTCSCNHQQICTDATKGGEGGGNGAIIAVIVILVLVLAAGGGYYMYKKKQEESQDLMYFLVGKGSTSYS